MSTPETFCGAISPVVCVRCPLRNIDEVRWSRAVLEGVTPYDLAYEFGKAVLEAYSRFHDAASDAESIFQFVGSNEVEEHQEFLLILDKADKDPDTSSANTFAGSVSDSIVAEDLRGKILRRGSAKTRGIVRTFGACVAKQAAGKCSVEALYRPATPIIRRLLEQLVTAESGANVLDDFARHGNLAEVRVQATKVSEVLLDAINRRDRLLGRSPTDFNAWPEYAIRGYLMLVAKALRSGVLNTDAPGTLD